MPDRGKLAVVAIVAVALGLATFAWYWRWHAGHRAAAFWGPEVALLIRGAPKAELLLLKPLEEPQESDSDELDSLPENGAGRLSIGGRSYAIAESVDLANTPGLIHARHSLAEDASFVWDPPADECPGDWTHAMRLEGNGSSAVLAFDFECRRIALVEENKVVTVVARISDGFQRVFQRAAESHAAESAR